MSISGMTTGGQRFPFDQFRQSQTRGARYRPLSGVLSGLSLSASTLTLAVDGSQATVAVAAGKGKLDAQDVALATGGAAILSLSGFTLVNGYNTIPVFLNPTRLVPTSTAAPAPNAPGAEGDRLIHVADLPDGQVVIDLYEKIEGVWKVIHPRHGKIGSLTPASAIMSSYTRGHAFAEGEGNLAMPLNEIAPTLNLSTNFAHQPEKFVFFQTQVPTQFTQPQRAILRQPAGFLLGQLYLDVLQLPIRVYATASGSTLQGNFAPLLKAGASTVTNSATRFRVNGLGLTNEGITAIATDGQTITVGTATPQGSGWVEVVPHASVSPVANYLSVIAGANQVIDLSAEAALLI